MVNARTSILRRIVASTIGGQDRLWRSAAARRMSGSSFTSRLDIVKPTNITSDIEKLSGTPPTVAPENADTGIRALA
jgi:hypothetical protein